MKTLFLPGKCIKTSFLTRMTTFIKTKIINEMDTRTLTFIEAHGILKTIVQEHNLFITSYRRINDMES